MKTTELKVTRIGNSRGVRLPAAVLRRYRIGGAVVMEQKSEGILLRPTGRAVEKLSWEQTAREMAANREDWHDWDATAGDGLATVPWKNGLPPNKPTASRLVFPVTHAVWRAGGRDCGGSDSHRKQVPAG